jgi:hypothetical protein
MPSGITYVTTVDLNGLPTEPPEERKSLKCTYGFQVRDNVSITIQDIWTLRTCSRTNSKISSKFYKIKFN